MGNIISQYLGIGRYNMKKVLPENRPISDFRTEETRKDLEDPVLSFTVKKPPSDGRKKRSPKKRSSKKRSKRT